MTEPCESGHITSTILILLSLAVGISIVVGLFAEVSTIREKTVAAGEDGSHPAPDGAELYRMYCQICHGEDGRGQGPASLMLNPPPRDFSTAKFRIVSYKNGVASREDVIDTIRNGMPGTSMPAWLQLSDEELGALADYVLQFGWEATYQTFKEKLGDRRSDDVIRKLVDRKLTPKNPVDVPEPPEVTSALLAQGEELFRENCMECHGEDGKGMTNPDWTTAEGYAIDSRDFTGGIFKGGGSRKEIFTRIAASIPGSPMPKFSSLSDEEIWSLVYYVKSFAGDLNPGDSSD